MNQNQETKTSAEEVVQKQKKQKKRSKASKSLKCDFSKVDITDNLTFKYVMKNKSLCKQVLEVILGVKIRDIVYQEEEKEIDLTYDARGIRLDVYLADENDTVYNLEMQVNKYAELRRRTRYYQGMVDLDQIERGCEFSNLPDSYVIFICTFDPFEQGRSIYTFRNICEQDKELYLEDGTTKIILNATANHEDVDGDLRALLDYVKDKKITNALTRALEEEVVKVKEQKQFKIEYMATYAREHDMLREGKRLGAIEGEVLNNCKIIRKQLSKNCSLETIADIIDWDMESVKKVADIIQESPEITDEEIMYVLRPDIQRTEL